MDGGLRSENRVEYLDTDILNVFYVILPKSGLWIEVAYANWRL